MDLSFILILLATMAVFAVAAILYVTVWRERRRRELERRHHANKRRPANR